VVVVAGSMGGAADRPVPAARQGPEYVRVEAPALGLSTDIAGRLPDGAVPDALALAGSATGRLADTDVFYALDILDSAADLEGMISMDGLDATPAGNWSGVRGGTTEIVGVKGGVKFSLIVGTVLDPPAADALVAAMAIGGAS